MDRTAGLHYGEQGSLTRLVRVYMRCDDLPFNPFLSSLPRMLCVPPDEDPVSRWISVSVPCFVDESATDRPGVGCVLSRLSELLFIEILRRHIAVRTAPPAGLRPWATATSRALAAIHADPQRAWTVPELAR